MENRVVITGLGAITPIGNNVKEFWTNAKKGVCGIDEITLFDASDYKVKIAGEVKNFKAEDFIDKKEAKRLDRFTHFALAATEEAMKDAKLDLKDENVDPNRVGVIVGSGIGGYGTLEAQFDVLLTKGPNRVSPFAIPSGIINLVAGNIAIKYGAKGVCESLVTACATGVSSIGAAYRSIKHGYSDIVISGGSEASITRAAIAGFTNLKALNTNNDPKRASIPFDKERSGFVMGEGAGILILESLESAQKRGARIYGEIIGYGATCDAYHITSPDPEGDGAKRAIEAAIEEGKINKDEIDIQIIEKSKEENKNLDYALRKVLNCSDEEFVYKRIIFISSITYPATNEGNKYDKEVIETEEKRIKYITNLIRLLKENK